MSTDFTAEGVFNFVLIAGAIYGFIFNAVVFFSKRSKGQALLYLNLLVLFISLNNLQAWLIAKEMTSSNEIIHFLRVPWYFLCTPMFYGFIVYYLKVQDKVRSFIVLSFAVFIGMCVIRFLAIIYLQSGDLTHDKQEIVIDNYSKVEEIISLVYALIIFRKPIQIFSKNKKLLEYVMNYDDLKWFKHFLFFAGLIFCIWIFSMVQNTPSEKFSEPANYRLLRLSTSVLIYWIGFKGLFRYRILEDRIVLRESINQELMGSKEVLQLNLANSGGIQSKPIKSEKQQQLFNKINTYVKEQKKFLDPYLSLESLAEEVQISSGHLSFLINHYGEYNFSDYINSFRVGQSKAFIMEDDYTNYTILSIGLESGFNSKSTFYAAFKKFTGLSPTQFKNKYAA